MEPTSNRRLALLWLVAAFGTVSIARYEMHEHPVAAPAVAEVEAPRAHHEQANALRDERKVDINMASADELELLPTVGPSLARRIVEAREKHGPFTAPNELLRVRGVGQKTLAKLLPLLTFGSEQLEHTAQSQLPLGAPSDVARLEQQAGAHVNANGPRAASEVVEAEHEMARGANAEP